MYKVAAYAGSFDPFTNGHLHIVKEASELFDRVYIVIAVNPAKKRTTDRDAMVEAIKGTLIENKIEHCVVITHDGLIADFCEEYDVHYLIRGLRNTSDYLYEENIAKINKEINPDLKTIYLRADNEVISSSMVRELNSYGKDISRYVPQKVHYLLKRNKEVI